MVQERRFIIVSSKSTFLNYFEYLVMTLAIWNACWTPLTISFERAKEIGGSVGFVIIDECVNAIFWMDIFLQFASSYVEASNGEEINAPKKIAKHYIF